MSKFIPANLQKFVPGKKLAIGLTLAALAAGGTAIAAQASQSRADANNDGVVTRAESQALTMQRFALLDANKDGKIDPSDRGAMGTAVFARIDADKNGQISQTEFDAARMQRLDAMAGDGRGRGHGGRHDGGFGGGRHGGGHGGGHGGFGRGANRLLLADANKDGAVSQAEFSAAAKQRFDLVDTDNDGQTTAAERLTARVTLRNQRLGAPAAPAPTN